MTDKPLITGRPTLTINEAAQICKCDTADLLYKAEIGELTIYAIADGWKVGRITEIDHSLEFAPTKGVRFRRLDGTVYLGALPDKTEDVIFAGNYITYGSEGRLRIFYDSDLEDRQPITARTFKEYRISSEKATVEIDFNQLHKLSDKVHERYMCPEPAVLIHDLFLNGKLVVMKADIQRLRGLSPDDNLSELFEHEYWPPELGMAIAAWQHARDEFQTGQKPKEIMEKWLATKRIDEKPLSAEAIERISTIANWEKKGGRKKRMDGE